jgi:hypothetical protein
MTETQFWQLVTRTHADQSSEQIVQQLQQSLDSLDDESLKAFDKMFGQQLRRSYQWAIWGAAYIVLFCH